MEKNHHNNNSEPASGQHNHEFTGNQPGQQLPANAGNNEKETTSQAEQHSESSLPQQDNETLGTP